MTNNDVRSKLRQRVGGSRLTAVAVSASMLLLLSRWCGCRQRGTRPGDGSCPAGGTPVSGPPFRPRRRRHP